jgi:hypothetical protein
MHRVPWGADEFAHFFFAGEKALRPTLTRLYFHSARFFVFFFQ